MNRANVDKSYYHIDIYTLNKADRAFPRSGAVLLGKPTG
ncbi:MAG: hypothetical protein ACI8PP_001382 [Candidatus Pseudothioglobus sp.]|jgi:hypothetical protein